MASLLKNLLISIVVGIIVYFIAGYIQHGVLVIPNSFGEIAALVVIAAGVFIGSLLGAPASTTAGQAEHAGNGRELGTVKWFNVKKGYGFITRDQGDDVFVHYRNIKGQGRRAISEGQRVEFNVVNSEKGLQADEVEPL